MGDLETAAGRRVRRAALAATVAVQLAACAGGAGLPAGLGLPPLTWSPRTDAAASDPAADKASDPTATTTAAAGQTPAAPAAGFSVDGAKLDLAHPDGRACRASADGGTMANLAIVAQITVALGTDILIDSAVTRNPKELQQRLDRARPGLRELSKRVVWLPESAEGWIGQQMLRSAEPPYEPNARERRVLDQVVRPIFDSMASFSKRELGSTQKFEMRVLNRNSLSPEMVPGGTLIVPSQLLRTLSNMPERDQAARASLVAFVMSHEFSHALRRHVTKATQAKLIDGMTMSKAFTANFKGIRTGFDAASSLSQMFDLSSKGLKVAMDAVCQGEQWFTEFDQTQELEADVCGALLLSKLPRVGNAHYDALEGLRQYNRAAASVPPAEPRRGVCIQAATHPSMPAREENLQEYQRSLVSAR